MLSQQFAEKVLQTPICQDTALLQLATQGVMDFLACSLQAKDEVELKPILAWIEQEGGNANSWLIGQQRQAAASQAALYNGFQAHLLDYDDVHSEVRGHPSAVILPALFASLSFEPTEFVNSQRFLTAYIIGIEVMARLGGAMNPQHYAKGWHSTATFGVLGAVTAICYLHRYDFLSQALALAATQSSGLRLLFGTPIKPLHAGMAAQNAIQSIQWLKAGLTAERDAFDPKAGFLAVYAESATPFQFADWGEQWRIQSPGLWFKTYSYCSAAAYVADATEILCQQDFTVPEIEQINLIFPEQGDAALIYPHPTTQNQGQFSAEYIVAKLLLQQPLYFAAFSEQPVPAEVQTLIAKMTRQYQPEKKRFAEVQLILGDGRRLSQRIDTPKGSPQNPYPFEALARKLEQAVKNPQKFANLMSQLQQLAQGINMLDFAHQQFSTL